MPPTTRRSPSDHQSPRKRSATKRPAAQQDTRIPTEETDAKYAATSWGSSVGGAEDLTMPSGQMALVKRPGVEGLIKAGVLHDVDSLTAIVDKTHLQKGGTQVNVSSLMQDESALANVIHTVDRITCHVVMKPQVFMNPNDITSRKPGVVYCDMIELEDKMFIFNFAVGGTRDFEQFRKDTQVAMGDLGSQ